MRICIPVADDRGLESRVNPHFGSAPAYLIVDTGSKACQVLDNRHTQRDHGACAPIGLLTRHGVEAVVVGGIGRGALGKLEAAGVEVLSTAASTAAEVVAAFAAGTLQRVSLDAACAHGHGTHHHGHDHDTGGTSR